MNERLDGIINQYIEIKNKKIEKLIKYCITHNFENIEMLKNEIERLKKENTALRKENNMLKKENSKLTIKHKNNCSKRIKSSKEYKEFRKKVLERDNYRCVKCGETENLQVHHIKPRKDYPDLVMNFDNVQTLCLLCHSKTESYLKN